MDIDGFIDFYDPHTLASEQDVRTKVSAPFLSCLGYNEKFYAEEFPVYAFEGGTPLKGKYADTIVFNDTGFADHRTKDDREWVMNHSLLIVELKKPGTPIKDSIGQAQFYAMWTRAIYYIFTNGIEIVIYQLANHNADRELCRCNIKDLAAKWLEISAHIGCNVLIEKKIQDNADEDVFRGYCISIEQKAIEKNSWCYTPKIQSNSESNQLVTVDKVFAGRNRILLLADAGMGKTSIFYKISGELAEKHLSGEQDYIPVVLQAKFWGRSYSSIPIGIVNALRPYIPSVTESTISAELREGKFYLLFDGIDECFTNRDILIEQIVELAFSSKNGIAISCRPSLYANELQGFDNYSLLELNEDDICKISKEVLGYDLTWKIRSMDGGIKTLIKKPLYLEMWLSFCKKNKDNELPNNIATLFDSINVYQLTDFLETKGNQDYRLFPLDSMKRILSLFAFKTLDSSEKFGILDAIEEVYGQTHSVEKITRILLQSGILYSIDGILDFQLYSIKEYFFANYLVNLDINVALDFLNINLNSDKHREIILLWLGLIQNDQHQDKVLDFIEGRNLSLYSRSLKRRYNFSKKYLEMLSQETCQRFFDQIMKSYLTIIDAFFPRLKEFFGPWIYSEDKQAADNRCNLRARCMMDINTLDVSVDLACTNENNEPSVIIEYKNSTPQIQIVNNGKPSVMRVSSMTDNCIHFYFNLNEIYSGIDCAREIAIKMIEGNLKRILESNILLLCEPEWMQIEMLESLLERIPAVYIEEDGIRKRDRLSLHKQTLAQIEQIFINNRNFLDTYNINGKSIQVTAPLLVQLVHNALKSGIDPLEVLPPPYDKEIGNEGATNENDLFSHATYKKWTSLLYNQLQIQYRLFSDALLFEIKQELPMYNAGPFQYHIDMYFYKEKNFLSAGFLEIECEPKNSISECQTEITVYEDFAKGNEKHSLEYIEKYHRDLQKKLQFLNRSNNGYYGLVTCELPNMISRDPKVRNEVYKCLKNDFQHVFKSNSF